MTKRKKLSNSLRFEVFKRDSFTCQYCGRKAPEVVLELEHIEPVSKGGSDEILNLITSCWQCNSGKGDRKLADGAVLAKQHAQLAELQERREQLDMLLRWRDANVDMEGEELKAFLGQFSKRVPGCSINDTGLPSIKRLLARHGLARALDALDSAVAHRNIVVVDGRATQDSIDGIVGLIIVMAEPPDIQRLYLIRSRIRHRWHYVNDGICIGLLRKVLGRGVPVDEIEAECDAMIRESPSSFTWWRLQMEEWLKELSNG